MFFVEPRGNGIYAICAIENGSVRDFARTGDKEEAERITKNLNKKETEEKK